MKKSKLKENLKYVLIFLVGFAVAMYPLISRLYYRIEANSAVHDFDTTAKKIDKKEIDLSLIHISEPTRREWLSRMPSSA